MMDEEEILSEDPVMNAILKQEEYLRENYTEKDFLNNKKTREILFNNFIETFDRNLSKQVESFYETERTDMVNSISNMFYYDTQGYFISELKGIILSHINPKFDLEILYECPHLASHMINDNYENKVVKVKEQVIIEKKEKVASDFNWAKNI